MPYLRPCLAGTEGAARWRPSWAASAAVCLGVAAFGGCTLDAGGSAPGMDRGRVQEPSSEPAGEPRDGSEPVAHRLDGSVSGNGEPDWAADSGHVDGSHQPETRADAGRPTAPGTDGHVDSGVDEPSEPDAGGKVDSGTGGPGAEPIKPFIKVSASVPLGERIAVHFSHDPAKPKDWVGLYSQNDRLLARKYLGTEQEGTVWFVGRAPGAYQLRLFRDDTFELVMRRSFIIAKLNN